MIADIFNLYAERWSFFSELIVEHIVLTLIAVAIITAVGLSLGIFMTRHRVFARVMLGITNFLYTIPSIALFGVLLVITGIGDTTAVLALVIYGLLPMIRNTYVGIREVDEQIIEAALGMGSTKTQLLLRVQLPLALPVIFAGFRTMVVMTIALAGIASFIGAGGLGVAIWRGVTTNYFEMTVAGSLLVAALAIIVDYSLEFAETAMRRRVLGEERIGRAARIGRRRIGGGLP